MHNRRARANGAFLPCARALRAELHLDWPAELERATLAYLNRPLDFEIDA